MAETRGRKRKSVREHKAAGTYRPDRHGPDPDAPQVSSLCHKPKLRKAKACGSPRRWIRNAADERAVHAGYYFDEQQADYVAEWFAKYLQHSKGQHSGKPFELLEWQRENVTDPLFGWKAKDGKRRFRSVYIEIPKKNGKTTLAAGIGLYMLCGDGEKGAQVFTSATSESQATMLVDESMTMVEANPAMLSILSRNRTTHTLYNTDLDWKFAALPYKARSIEGKNAHCFICDELHVWQGREMWEALRYAGAGRVEPILFSITTAGDDTESVCYQQHEHAIAVRDGKITDHRFLGFIAGAEQGDRHELVRTWKKANPSLGVTIDKEDFRADFERAKREGAREFASFKRYRLNVWHTGTDAWIDTESWALAHREYTESDCEQLQCWAGLDMARKNDLTALVLLFKAGDVLQMLPYFWLPEARAKQLDHLVSYRQWAEEGLITLTPGNVADFDQITAGIIDILGRFNPDVLVFDPCFAEETTQRITNATGVEREEFRQAIYNYAGPTAAFDRMLEAGELVHNGHPLLAWQAGNAELSKPDRVQRSMPVKPKLKSHKSIDGIVAAVMALAAATREADPAEQFAYSDDPVESW